MATRRGFLLNAGILAAGIGSAQAQDACEIFTKSMQAATTPGQALTRLKDGNARFVSGHTVNCDLPAQVKGTAGGQAPFAVVLACMDSRVSPELIFDQRLGDIFALRVAGNFVNPDMLGSMEYATKVVGTKLIVVLGHTDCGAVKGAIDDVKLGHLTGALAKIRPAVTQITDAQGERTSKNKKFVQRVADRNAMDAAAQIAASSPVLAALVKSGDLVVHSAMHDVTTGVVSWLS